MSTSISKNFPVKNTLYALRNVGYSHAMAVADIIDNSISALATKIDIFSEPYKENSYICFLDNGRGMTFEKLDNAMEFGSNREDVPDSDIELGRYGMGLKSASISQCKKLTVVSKVYDEINAMEFDIDIAISKENLCLSILSKEEINKIPHINDLLNYETGTLVVWQKFDTIENSSNDYETTFRNQMSITKAYVEKVFHRFYDSIIFRFNTKRMEKRDPMLSQSYGRTQIGRPIQIQVGDSVVTATPYTLPHFNSLTPEELSLLGNPKTIYQDQGFYIYRNNRLISFGGWLYMNARSETNKLARVAIDIPSTLDSMWKLDLKKSQAYIPDNIKNRIRYAINESTCKSTKVIRTPGHVEKTGNESTWQRVIDRDGTIQYQINREHKLINSLCDIVDSEALLKISELLDTIESELPRYQIMMDGSSRTEPEKNEIDDVDIKSKKKELVSLLKLFNPSIRAQKLNDFLSGEYSDLTMYKEEILEEIK